MSLAEVKTALRISATNTFFDAEVQGLIDAAKIDLVQSGVDSTKANDDTDPLIKRAVIVYCKGYFGYDNPEAARFIDSYVMLKQHLSLASDYNGDANAV